MVRLSPIVAGTWRAPEWGLDAQGLLRWMEDALALGITSFDHADIYKDLDAIKWQFSRLMNLVPGNGHLICGIDSLVVGEVLDQMKGKLHTTVETFGLSDNAKWQARDIEFSAEGTRFNVYKKTDDQRSTINPLSHVPLPRRAHTFFK